MTSKLFNLISPFKRAIKHSFCSRRLLKVALVVTSLFSNSCIAGQDVNSSIVENKSAEAQIRTLTEIIESPDSTKYELESAYNNRAIAYFENGDVSRAISDYNKVIEISPTNPIAYLNRGFANYCVKDYDSAIADYNKAIQVQPDIASAYVNRALFYEKIGEYEPSIADLDKAIELTPTNPDSYNAKAWLLASAPNSQYRDGKLAVQLAIKAIELVPEYSLYQNTLAAAYAESGEFSKAAETQKIALELLRKEGATNLIPDYAKRLHLYQSGKPYYQSE